MLEHLFDAMNPIALIETDDGAQIPLDTRGFARRATVESPIWAVAATLRLQSDDRRYRSVDDALVVWAGEFDADAHRARYRAYALALRTSEGD